VFNFSKVLLKLHYKRCFVIDFQFEEIKRIARAFDLNLLFYGFKYMIFLAKANRNSVKKLVNIANANMKAFFGLMFL